jgi:AraC family transcriptional regulator, regulatory protein of adaptative response / methylated-DNA-[protein]-cysteine methyltransferase
MIQSSVRKTRAQQDIARVTAVCRLIEHKIEAGKRVPALECLAKYAGLSPFHFQRLFRRVTGVTPRDYAAARREGRLREGLGRGESVTQAIADAGYNSSSRFYEKADAVLGMMPSRYRAGGAQEEIRFAVGECSLGSILVARSGRGICAILLGDDPDALLKELQDSFARANLIGGEAKFEKLVAQVVGFVEAPGVRFDLPLDIRGTAFQKRVWEALQKIPPGGTASYAEIARRIGAPKSVRAVAGACAANTLAVAIPCHRVVRNDGTLSGYRWGVERKRALLDKESKK